MGVGEEGREPSGWELLRGLREVKETVQAFQAGMVSLTTFLALAERVKALEEEAKERSRAQSRMWASIALAIIVAVVGIIVTLSLRGLGVSP